MMMKQNNVILSILCQGHCGKGLVYIAKALRFSLQQPCNIDHVSKAFKKMSHFICLVLFTAKSDPLIPCFFPLTFILIRIYFDENSSHKLLYTFIRNLVLLLKPLRVSESFNTFLFCKGVGREHLFTHAHY